jgi:hypothetical protein
MRGFLIFVALVLVLLAGAAGAMWFLPDIRPDFVKPWFRTATGFTEAKTPEEALEKFKRALAARDYETAALYCSGNYKDVLERNKEDARALGLAIDDLRATMKSKELKSDKAQFTLIMLDPFPASFKIDNVKKSGDDKATAVLDWKDEMKNHEGQFGLDWKVNPLICNTLLPQVVRGLTLEATLERQPDGAWAINLPASVKERTLTDTTAYLRKNGSNYKNVLVDLKNQVKEGPPTKDDFDNSLKDKLEKSK